MVCKRGDILIENIIFIILNLIFFTILILFIFSRTGSAALLEEEYAKQIALIIDAAKPGTIVDIKPGMIIHMNMEELIDKAEKEGFEGNIVSITGNLVTVKLRSKGGYSYSFFNDVDVFVFPDTSSKPIKEYIITINKK